MAAIKHYINASKGEQATVWIITTLLAVASFPRLVNFIVYVLIKLYELFVQHVMGKSALL